MMGKRKVYTLQEYIDIYHDGVVADFAKANGCKPPLAYQWLKKDFVVINGEMFSYRRTLRGGWHGSDNIQDKGYGGRWFRLRNL